MSPSRKAAIVGLIVGFISLLAAPVVVILPGFLVQRGADAPRAVSFLVYITAGFVYAPIAFVLGIFGVVILIISIPIYSDAKRKETRVI